MTWWNRLKKIMASEAQDAKEELDKLRDAVDVELSRKEREMNATPSERLEMILEDIDADQVRLEAIEPGLKADTASEAGPDENAVTHPVAEPEEPLEPDEPSGSEEPPRRARLLGPGDVPAHPHLADGSRMGVGHFGRSGRSNRDFGRVRPSGLDPRISGHPPSKTGASPRA